MIKSVKVWRNIKKTECRIYVHTIDGREGCKYMTGNPWNAKGSIDGNLTAEEWVEAKALAVVDGKWTTFYMNDKPAYYTTDEDARADLAELNRTVYIAANDTAAMKLEETGYI